MKKSTKIIIWVIVLVLILSFIIWWACNHIVIQDKKCLDKIGLDYCSTKNLTYEGVFGDGLMSYEQITCVDYINFDERLTKFPRHYYFYYTDEEVKNCQSKLKSKLIGERDNGQ